MLSKSRNRIHQENIGYIYMATFNEEGLLDDFDIFMDQMMHTKGLIIDVRCNSGGLLEIIDQVVSHFIQSPLAYPKGFSKGNVPCYKSPVQPKTDKSWYVNPVILLINGVATSGGDVIAELMKQVPNVTVVSDTTNGAGCNNHPYELIENDYFLPSGKYVHVDF